MVPMESNMSESNPLELARDLKSTLQRYLQTSIPISRNYPKLREEHQKLIKKRPLVRGPFVEALPDFEKHGTLRQLLRSSGGPVHDGLGKLPADVLDRPRSEEHTSEL